MSTPHDHVEATREDHLEDLFTLLAQPSISTTDTGVGACLDIIESLCTSYGLEDIERIETDGQPALIARASSDRPDAIEVLMYGHYDVQPADPADWDSPPFEPTIRPGPDGRDRIYARGAGDNKGQWFAHLVAIDALQRTTGMPVDVTLLLEGEEESGSPHIDQVADAIAGRTDPDLIYVADGPIDQAGIPHVIMGVRGILYVELTAKGPNRDLHSGGFGGIAPNPAWALMQVVSSMKDERGNVVIDGFTEDVRPITDADRAVLDRLPYDAEQVSDDIGIEALESGPGDHPLENLSYYPTLNICGIESGYTDPGMMTIIPSEASMKIDMRLVADQDPDDIYQKFVDHVTREAPDNVDISIERLASMVPHRTPVDHPLRKPIVEGVAEAWDMDVLVKPALGGSLPTGTLARRLDAPTISVPYANHDEQNHAPNENLALWCFENGVDTTINVLDRLGAIEH